MTLLEIGFLTLLFCSAAALAMFAYQTFGPSALRGRLRKLLPESTPDAEAVAAAAVGPSWWRRAAKVTQPFAKLSLPEGDVEEGSFRIRFFNAGLRDPSAPTVYFGAKTALAVVFPVVVFLIISVFGANLSFNGKLALLLGMAAFGYYLPNIVMSKMVENRKRDIFEAFPDALDLMTVCVEAGLGMESAIKKVAEEIGHKSRVLSEELHLVSLDLRAGSDRQRALRNLAMRTGVDEVQTWAAMLIQSDRFGTSIGASLRIHSDMLRTKRRQRAEETAAKISVKLMFPLMVCIFPALMVVLGGPPFIQIYRVLLPTFGGG